MDTGYNGMVYCCLKGIVKLKESCNCCRKAIVGIEGEEYYWPNVVTGWKGCIVMEHC